MVTLAIDFQDGFKDDVVTLQLDEKEIFIRQHVSTSLLLGFADSFRTEVRKGPVTVEMSIETRGLVATIPLQILVDTYVGISVVNDRVQYIISNEPFGYG